MVGSVILGLLLKNITAENYITDLKDYITLILIVVLNVIAIRYIIYKKFREVNKELENQKSEQKRLNEKLKIYERLSKIEERIFKNGHKN